MKDRQRGANWYYKAAVRFVGGMLIGLAIGGPGIIAYWILIHKESYPLGAVSLASFVDDFMLYWCLFLFWGCFLAIAVRSKPPERRLVLVGVGTVLFLIWLYVVFTSESLARELSAFIRSVSDASP